MMDIGKDLQDAYECGRQDALNELMEYTYAMLTAEKFGLQHKIKSMMADRKTEQTEPRLEQFRVGLEYHTDSVNFGKPKGESITTNKTEPQIEKCPFDDSLPCEWVCTEYGKCKYKPQTEPQTDCSWK